jgi:hypothetical protein
VPINYTIDNWVALSDTNLYLYAPYQGTHALTVNDEDFTVVYDEEAGTFVVTPGAPEPEPAVGLPGSGKWYVAADR